MTPQETGAPLLAVEGLSVEFPSKDGPVNVVSDVSFTVTRGEVLGILGESGSGKSITSSAVIRMVPTPGRVASGTVHIDGRNIYAMSAGEVRRVRGSTVGVVFQDPMTSLNPVFRVGWQIAEAIQIHTPGIRRSEAKARVLTLLSRVGITDPERRYRQYPHELSGGLRQRALIAMALANNPSLLIADEPTTALDVTIQAQILDLLADLQRETGQAVIFITHDLGVVAEFADRVIVMYAGRVVEQAPVPVLFTGPKHPYTRGLLDCLPRIDGPLAAATPIPGTPPPPGSITTGCPFQPRCPIARGRPRCVEQTPALRDLGNDQAAACHYAEELP